MTLAAIDWVWLIIAIIVIIGKLWNKFVEMQSQEKEPPPAKAPPPVRRQAQPQPRPSGRPAQEESRQAPPEDLREFMERLTRPSQPKQPAPPPPMARPVPPPPPAPKPAAAPVPPPPEPEPARLSRRAAQWAEAFRDRQNLRNIVIASEIIGPPRGA